MIYVKMYFCVCLFVCLCQLDVRLSVQYMSFSAHADAKGIMQLISHCEPRNVMLVHGEGAKMQFLQNKIKQEFGVWFAFIAFVFGILFIYFYYFLNNVQTKYYFYTFMCCLLWVGEFFGEGFGFILLLLWFIKHY